MHGFPNGLLFWAGQCSLREIVEPIISIGNTSLYINSVKYESYLLEFRLEFEQFNVLPLRHHIQILLEGHLFNFGYASARYVFINGLQTVQKQFDSWKQTLPMLLLTTHIFSSRRTSLIYKLVNFLQLHQFFPGPASFCQTWSWYRYTESTFQ